MIPRRPSLMVAKSLPLPPCPGASSAARSLCAKNHRHCYQTRGLATSAQKRKWARKQGANKPFVKKKHAAWTESSDAVAAAGGSKDSKAKADAATHWRPLFFLGVFPVFMSVVVVLNRDDLREEVNSKGIGRFVEDYKKWRRTPRGPLVSEPAAPASGPAVPSAKELSDAEEESEYDRMMNLLGHQQNGTIAPNTEAGGNHQ